MYYDFFFFFVMLYSNFVMNTLKKIPGAATGGSCCCCFVLFFFFFFFSVTRFAVRRRWQALEWQYLSLWQLVCGLIPVGAKLLERFNFESFAYSCLGVESLKNCLEYPCRRIAWSWSVWLTRFEYLFISSVEGLPPCLLWI